MMLGFMNFVMELAPREEGPTYVGLANTLGAILLFYPLLGGILLERISYSGLFSLTALVICLALLLGTRLREPRPASPPDPGSKT
jgi:MFS family permease